MFTFSHFLRFIRLLLLFIVTFFLAWDSLKEFFKKTWFYLNFLIYYLMSKLNLVLGQSFASAFFIGFSVWILLIFVVKILQLNIHGACIIYISFQWIRLTVQTGWFPVVLIVFTCVHYRLVRLEGSTTPQGYNFVGKRFRTRKASYLTFIVPFFAFLSSIFLIFL